MIDNLIQRRGFVNWCRDALQRRQEDDKDYCQEQHYTRIVLGDNSNRQRAMIDGMILSDSSRSQYGGDRGRAGVPSTQEMIATSLELTKEVLPTSMPEGCYYWQHITFRSPFVSVK